MIYLLGFISYVGAAIALLDVVYLPLHISGVSFRMIGYGLPRVCVLYFVNPPIYTDILFLFRLGIKRLQITLMLIALLPTSITSQQHHTLFFQSCGSDHSDGL